MAKDDERLQDQTRRAEDTERRYQDLKSKLLAGTGS
jgi:hypothetical protein